MPLDRFLPILLLVGSNIFMTFAWYGHLKFGAKPLWIVVLISWGIAFFEYWLAVPANQQPRAGIGRRSVPAQLSSLYSTSTSR